MNKVLIAYCTEYEFGQRPDGFMVSENLEAMKKRIKETHEMGSAGCYWRYEEPYEVYCDDETYAKIKAKMNKDGITFFDNNAEDKLNLFKKI